MRHSLNQPRTKSKRLWRPAFAALCLVGLAVVLMVHTRSQAPAVAVPHKTTARPTALPAVSPCRTNRTGQLLLVSISKQRLWACDGPSEVRQSAVTTGRSVVVNGVDDSTPTGTWHILAKYTNVHLRGSDANGVWDDPVRYWMPFDGSIGFHDASWQTFPFGADGYKPDGSHGCVHVPVDTAAWLFSWAPIGTTVTVHT